MYEPLNLLLNLIADISESMAYEIAAIQNSRSHVFLNYSSLSTRKSIWPDIANALNIFIFRLPQKRDNTYGSLINLLDENRPKKALELINVFIICLAFTKTA